MISEYRVRQQDGGWVVEFREGVAVIVAGTVISSPEWDVVGGPFPTEKEAQREMARLKAE